MTDDLTFVRPLVASILRDEHREWSVQGFGFLRTYFGPADAPKAFRLNLWDRRFKVPNVSTIHDHPWDFKSIIVAGQFANLRYEMEHLPIQIKPVICTHAFTTIRTGEGGGQEKDAINSCVLVPKPIEYYIPGDTYHQRADEIHETLFLDGAVTLNERIGDTEHARVFWPYGTDWVDAMPRPATRAEVSDAVSYSLKEWF
jgi:hypothetical protein